jgi:acyl-coenzyme A synthetase/AMP-(fatty) acid ligase
MAGGAEPDATALETFTRDRLAPYKVPKRWVFADELPRTASGKVQKFLLLETLDGAEADLGDGQSG